MQQPGLERPGDRAALPAVRAQRPPPTRGRARRPSRGSGPRARTATWSRCASRRRRRGRAGAGPAAWRGCCRPRAARPPRAPPSATAAMSAASQRRLGRASRPTRASHRGHAATMASVSVGTRPPPRAARAGRSRRAHARVAVDTATSTSPAPSTGSSTAHSAAMPGGEQDALGVLERAERRLDRRPRRVPARRRTGRRRSRPCRWNGAASTGPGDHRRALVGGRPPGVDRARRRSRPPLGGSPRLGLAQAARDQLEQRDRGAGVVHQEAAEGARGTTRPRTSSSAVTDAERGWPSIPDRSPSSSPGPRSATTTSAPSAPVGGDAHAPRAARAARSPPCRPARR